MIPEGLIKAEQQHNLTSHIKNSLPLLIPADHAGQLVQWHPGLRPPVLQQLHNISCLKYPRQTHPHPFTTHSKS